MVSFDARAGKWLALVLLVSLAGNAFMGGILVGRWAHGPVEFGGLPMAEPIPVQEPQSPAVLPGPGPGPGPAGMAAQDRQAAGPAVGPLAAQVRRFVMQLPPRFRQRFLEPFLARRPEIAAAVAAARETGDRLRAALAAEPFDRARVDAGFAELRQRNAAVQTLLHQATAEGAMNLPPDLRQRLADIGERPLRRPLDGTRPRP